MEKCLLSEEEVLRWGLDKGKYLVISSECDGSLSVIDLEKSGINMDWVKLLEHLIEPII
ncbi:hypothetical protein [Clostridium sp.]|uniref:hypothetical protein n=1 Tax=Clostridium sp. TaxID=1506 RepID=UPI0026078994|nr:hypothetical protein [Clostridium sp.]